MDGIMRGNAKIGICQRTVLWYNMFCYFLFLWRVHCERQCVKEMRVLVIGDGKVGHTLVESLAQEGHDVVIVDSND